MAIIKAVSLLAIRLSCEYRFDELGHYAECVNHEVMKAYPTPLACAVKIEKIERLLFEKTGPPV